MPVKLKPMTALSVPGRIDKLRQTLKPDEGMTMEEVAAHPTVCACESSVRDICTKRKWSVLNYNPTIHRPEKVLVHPKTLATYAAKT